MIMHFVHYWILKNPNPKYLSYHCTCFIIIILIESVEDVMVKKCKANLFTALY